MKNLLMLAGLMIIGAQGAYAQDSSSTTDPRQFIQRENEGPLHLIHQTSDRSKGNASVADPQSLISRENDGGLFRPSQPPKK